MQLKPLPEAVWTTGQQLNSNVSWLHWLFFIWGSFLDAPRALPL